MSASTVFVVVSLLCQLPAESPADTPSTQDAIERAVEQLGHDQFEVRNRASDFLWQQGLRAVEPLQRAARGDALEVRLRALQILEDFEYGILPDVPEEVLRRIREFRGGNNRERQQAVQSLAEGQHWDTISNLLNRESNLIARRVLLIALFQSPAAIDRYGSPEDVAALVDAVAPAQGDPLWRRSVLGELLFSPLMIERLARQDQLSVLTQFLAREESPQVRSGAVNAVFRDADSLSRLMSSGSWPLMHAIVDAATAQTRPQLLIQLMREQKVITQIIEEDELDQLRELLAKIFDAPNAETQLPQLFETAGVRLILAAEGIDPLLNWLTQATDEPGAPVAAMMSSQVVQQWMSDAGTTGLMVDLAAKRLSPSARRAYLGTLFQRNFRTASLSPDAQLRLWELIKSDRDDTWKWETLAIVLRDPSMQTIAAEPKEITWLMQSLHKTDANQRNQMLLTLVTHNAWTSAAIEQGHLENLTSLIDAFEDPNQRGLLLGRIAQNPATVGHLKQKGQLEWLMKLAKSQSSEATRSTYLQGLLSNASAVTELVGGGHYEAMTKLILATEEPDRRAALLGAFVGHDEVIRYLSRQDKLKTLIDFAKQQDSAETRATFLKSLLRSDVIPVLLQQGYYKDLRAFLKDDFSARDQLAAMFYGNPAVIRHFLRDKSLADLVALAESSGPATQPQILQRLATDNTLTERLFAEGLADRYFNTLGKVADVNQRTAILGNLLSSPEFYAQLAASKQLDLVQRVLRHEADPGAKEQLLRRLFSNHQTVQSWIEAEQIEQLVQLAGSAPTPQVRAELLSTLVSVPAVLDHWARHKQLERALKLADSLDAATGRSDYLQRLYGNSSTLKKLIEAELLEELIELVNREPAENRGPWLQRLAQHPATAASLRAEGQLSKLIAFATDETDETVRLSYLTGLVQNGTAVSMLVDAGHYDQLHSIIFSQGDIVDRSRLFGQLMVYGNVVDHLSERDRLSSLLVYAESQADAEARTAFLHSLLRSSAIAALINQGHYERIRRLIEQDSPSRDSLAAMFYSNRSVLERHLKSNTADRILQHIDTLEPAACAESLRHILSNTKVTAELVRTGHLDTLLSVVRGIPTSTTRGELWGRLFNSPDVLTEIAAKKQLQRVIDLVQEDHDPNSLRMLTGALANGNAVEIWVRAEMLAPLIELVLQSVDPRQQADLLARIVKTDSVTRYWQEQGELTEVFALAESLGVEERRTYVRSVLIDARVVSRLIAADHWEEVLKAIEHTSDPQTQAAVLASLASNPAVAEALAKAGLTSQFFSFAREQPSAMVRDSYVRGLIYNRQAVSALVNEGHYESLASLVLSLDDATQRARYFGQLMQQEGIAEHLKKTGKLEALVNFAESQDLAESQSNFLLPLLTSSTLNLLLEQGYYDRLQAMLEKLASNEAIDSASRETLVARFYSNSQIFDRFEQPGQLGDLVQRVDSMKSAIARHEFLSRTLTNHKHLTRLIDSGQAETLAKMIGRDPETYHRQHLLRQLLLSSAGIERLAARRELPGVLEVVRSEANDEVRASLIERLISDASVHPKLVEAGLVPDLLSLVENQPNSKRSGELLGKLLASSVVTENLIEQGNLESKLRSLQSKQPAGTHAVRSLSQALLWDRTALTRWVDAGMLEALIEAIAADSDLDQRASTLGRLVVAPPVLETWKQKDRLRSILELADGFGDAPAAESRRNYFAVVLNNGVALQSLIEAGLFEQLFEAAEATSQADPQRTLLAALVRSPSAAEHLARQDKIGLLLELVRREEQGRGREALLAAVLQNEAAVSALIAAKRFQPLVELAEQLPSAGEKKAAMAQFLYSPPAVQYLAGADKLATFVRTLLGDPEHDLRSEIVGELLRQGPALAALDRAGILDDLLARIESADTFTRDDLLSRIFNAPGGALLLVQHDRTPLVLSTLKAIPRNRPGGSPLRNLLGQPQFLQALADKNQLREFFEAAEAIDGEPNSGPGFRPSLWETVPWTSESLLVLAEHGQLERLLTIASESPRPYLSQTLLRNLVHGKIFDSLDRPQLAVRLVELAKKSAEQKSYPTIELVLNNAGLRETIIADGQQDLLIQLLPRVRSAVHRERLRQQILESTADLMLLRASKSEPAEALEILEKHAAESGEGITLLASYLLTHGGLEQRIRELQAEEDAPAQTLAYLHRASGDLDAALQAAAEAGDAALVHYLTCEKRDWHAAAEQLEALDSLPPVPFQSPRRTEPQGRIERLGLLAAYWRLAGETGRGGEALQAIEQFAAQHDGERELQRRAATAMLLNDSIPPALEILQQVEAVQAFEAFVARRQYAAALEALGCPPGSEFDQQWYLSLPLAENSDPFSNGLNVARRRLETAVRVVEVFQQLGLEADAQRILRTLESYAQEQPERTERNDSWKRLHHQWLAAELYRIGFRGRAFRHADQAITEPAHENVVLYGLFKTRADEATAWWAYFREISSEAAGEGQASGVSRVVRRLGQIHAVLHRQAARSDEEFEQLVERAAKMDSLSPNRFGSHLTGLAETCIERSRPDLAERLLRQSGKQDWPTRMKLGAVLRQQEKWSEAGEVLLELWNADREQLAALYLSGDSLIQGGDTEEGQRRQEQANLLALPSMARYRMAGGLAQAGLTDAAAEQWRIVSRTAPVASWEWYDSIRRLADHIRHAEPTRAAELWEQYTLAMLQSSQRSFEATYCLRMPYIIRWRRVVAALERDDAEEALQQAQLALGAFPGGVEMVQQLVPELTEKGAPEIADQLHESVRQHLLESLQQFPASPYLHNEVAWLDARCQRNLDEALGHAERAVELRPRHGGYVDTLAEVHFQQGNRERAIELSQRSIDLAPANEELQRQLERFRNDPLPK